MRSLITVVLCSIALSVQAQSILRMPNGAVPYLPGPSEPIDLDKPGALEGLQHDNPKHYEDPAQTRITVVVDASVYVITARYTKDPAHLVPGR